VKKQKEAGIKMPITIPAADILTILALISAITGFMAWARKHWQEYINLKAGMACRQDDTVIIFRCLRALLEATLRKNENGAENLEKTLAELNRHIETRAAGLSAGK